MYTLLLKHTKYSNKLNDWRAYDEAEFGLIADSGGRISGYNAPTDTSVTNEAFATIHVGTMAHCGVYRARLTAHPKHQENAWNGEAADAIRSTCRAVVQKVEAA